LFVEKQACPSPDFKAQKGLDFNHRFDDISRNLTPSKIREEEFEIFVR
jgi:hypothetical protein